MHCPASNISIARNACLDNSTGDFLAFIDDDETASNDWLVELMETAEATGADAVLGPVRAVYSDAAPGWMRRGDFHSTRAGLGRRRDPHRLHLQRHSCAATRRALQAAASTSRSARPAARTPNSSPICTRPAAGSPMRRRPGRGAGSGQARARFSWLAKRRFRSGQTHGRLLGRRAGLAASLLPQARPCLGQGASIASRRPRRRSSFRSAATAIALRGIMHAGVVSRAARRARTRVSMATAEGGAAMQPDVSFMIAAFNARDIDRARHRQRARPAQCQRRGGRRRRLLERQHRRDRRAAFPEDRVRVVAARAATAARAAPAMPASRLRAAAGSPCSIPTTRSIPIGPTRMIRRAEEARSRRSSSTTSMSCRMRAAGAKRCFPRALLESLARSTLADFIAANLMFEQHILVRLHEADLRAAFPRSGTRLRYDETLRIGEDYILLASALAKGGRCAVEPSVGYSYHVRTGSISRVLELHHVEAMLAADADSSSATMRSMRAPHGRAGAAHPQPRRGGVVPVAGPASQGPGAAQGDRCSASRSGRVAASGMPIAARLRRGRPAPFNARAFDRSA